MVLNEDERRFLETVVFSEENIRADWECHIAHMEEDFANMSFISNIA